MNAIVERADPTLPQVAEPQSNDGLMSPFVQRMLDRMPAEATPEFLDKLLDTQAKHEAMQARRAYNDAMTGFRAELKPAKKTGKNAHLKTTYATFDDMLAAASVPLGSNGFNIEFKQSQDSGTVTITARVTHSMGHSEETSLTTNVQKQSGINDLQSLGLTISYLKRYTMAALLGLSTEDDDGHSNSEPTAPPSPPPASYTEAQLTAFSRAINKGDGFALKDLAAVVGKEVWISLFNSGEKGKIVAIKDKVRNLMNEAQETIEASHKELVNRMAEDDEMGAKEILEETDWHYIAPLADTELTNWIENING